MTSVPVNQFRVCLISPPFDRRKVYSSMGFAAPIEPPLGLAFIAGMLQSKGFDVKLIDSTTLGYDLKMLQQEIGRWRPHVVGIGANSPVYPIAVGVAEMVKQTVPSATVVLGGCHPTLYPRRAIRNASVDVVVVGEGEYATAEICTALAEGKALSGIAGIVYRSGAGIEGLVARDEGRDEPLAPNSSPLTHQRPLLEDLDRLPFPAFDLLPMRKYRISLGIARKAPAVSMVASRGCPMNCKFCTSPGIWKRHWRHHSPEYVADVVELLAGRYGVRHVQFRDDTFTIDKDWVLAICDQFSKRNGRARLLPSRKLTWDCYSTVGLIREHMVRRMKQSGCTCLSIGIESGNDQMLRKYKNTTKAEVREKMALLRRIGLRQRLFFMLAPPAEKHEHLQETLDFALELDPDFAMFLPTVPLPGSRLYRELVENDCGAPDYDHQPQNFQEVLYAPPPFSIDELEAFRSLCYRKFYFRPGYLWRMLPSLLTLDALKRSPEAVFQLPRLFRPTTKPAKAKA